ncbi:FAD-dependent oxidoreductase [Candidatus Pacearchaeota archaeon]|nr:FAD-dependent oxidoreductase [Candidatus Pacearchaeota archaeon]
MIQIFQSELLDVKNVSDSVKILRFSVPGNFDFKPGQYVSLSVPFQGKKLRRPYSIASSPGENYIETCVKLVDGPASKFIRTLKKGDCVELFGPAGKFLVDKNSLQNEIVFISVGTGITPFMSMIPCILKNKFDKKIIFIKGFRYEQDVLYDAEFETLKEKYQNFEFHNVLSRPKNPEFENRGYVQDFLEKYLGKNFRGHVYICGLSPMINAAKEKLISLGVEEKRILFEKYD